MNSRAIGGKKVGRICWVGAVALMLAAGAQATVPSSDAGQWDSAYPSLHGQLHVSERLYTEVSMPYMKPDEFRRGTIIAEEELGQMRAGFNLGGLDVDFGARLQTLIDNRIELVSVLNFTRAGVDIISQTFQDPVGSATRVGAGAGAVPVTEVTPPTVNLAGLADFSGIVLNDPKGFTAALHNVTREAIISGVVSNASGRDIRQRIDVNVRLNNVGALNAARKRAAILDSFSGILR